MNRLKRFIRWLLNKDELEAIRRELVLVRVLLISEIERKAVMPLPAPPVREPDHSLQIAALMNQLKIVEIERDKLKDELKVKGISTVPSGAYIAAMTEIDRLAGELERLKAVPPPKPVPVEEPRRGPEPGRILAALIGRKKKPAPEMTAVAIKAQMKKHEPLRPLQPIGKQ